MKKYSGITFSLATGLCGLAAQISPHNPAAKEFSLVVRLGGLAAH